MERECLNCGIKIDCQVDNPLCLCDECYTLPNEKCCPECGEEEMQYLMFDIDGTNLEEKYVCLSCKYNYPTNY